MSPSGPLKNAKGTLPEETIPTDKINNAIADEIVAYLHWYDRVTIFLKGTFLNQLNPTLNGLCI